MEFLRVFVKIVEFPSVDVLIEVDEFPTVGGAHAIVTLHTVLGRIFVVVVIEAFAPICGMFALEQGQQRLSLNVVGYFGAGDVEEGGRIVNVLHHLFDVATGRKTIG